MAPTLKVLDSTLLPAELASLIVALQDDALSTRGRFDIAVSGGSLAKTMAAGLLHNENAKLSRWNVWLADERIVPLDHEDSNYGVFYRDFISKIDDERQRPRCFTLNRELLGDPRTSGEEFAEDYEEQLKSELGPAPKIDLILLGMGPDGHTCSLFPGHQLLKEEKRYVAYISDSPKPPPRRITLTKPSLRLGGQLVFVATGRSKQAALQRVFKNDMSLPATDVNALAQKPVIWFCDKDAVNSH